ncbi:MAG: zf-TFIIB domain-containing protein [Gemmatimonadales bacterium]
MPEPETRYPCLVCLGTRMVKLKPSAEIDLLLDYCKRCGGMWFDDGEVDRLGRCRPQALAAQVVLSRDAYRMKCHSCHASLERNAARCPACGWENVLQCPTCGRALQAVERGGVKLDVCRRCRGAWFDNGELAVIWNRQVGALARHPVSTGDIAANYFLLDAFLIAPDLALHSAVGGAAAVDAVASAGGIAEIAGGVVEGTGELAGSVFETIAGLIGDLFG